MACNTRRQRKWTKRQLLDIGEMTQNFEKDLLLIKIPKNLFHYRRICKFHKKIKNSSNEMGKFCFRTEKTQKISWNL